ncbi:hypothetical protein PSMK_06260 [Phycisphaera mikurensis NBRC 102666]|uniref:DUF1570 domain-containing protein n=2 Tax=Phycisphaera TaxID=666508 RepID=I0IBZ7_PHYMF|nr:hypothetical protein PSMK_06260 [Phycisphaera mikurensis NBRC 102666]
MLALALALVLLAAAPSAPPAAAAGLVPDAAAPLSLYRSRHYLVHTDLPRAEAAPLGLHLDAVYDDLERRFEGFGTGRSRAPLDVYLFRHAAGYHAYLKSRGVAADHSGGMFFSGGPRGDALATWVSGRDPAATRAVLQHEGFHQFAAARLGQLPHWVNEGLAQYYEDAPLVNGRLFVGELNAERLAGVRSALIRGTAWPLPTLLRAEGRTWIDLLHRDPDRSRTLYAQSWSLVYFLIHAENGRYREAFLNYLRQLSLGQNADTALRTAFGITDASAMQGRWAAWLAGAAPPPVSEAAQRLEFLGQALAYHRREGWPMPRDLETLERTLVRRGFTLRRLGEDGELVFDAGDARLYGYVTPAGGHRRFVLLEAAGRGQPPRIAAVGLSPEPVLEWEASAIGFEPVVRYR